MTESTSQEWHELGAPIKGGKEMYGKVNKVKLALAEGRVALGTWVQMPSPEIVEAVGYQGFDYVIIDLEHGGFGLDTLPSMVRAAEAAGVTPIVRVPILEESAILWVLNTGAMGVQVPGISVSYTHLRAHETRHDLVCRLLLEKKKKTQNTYE